MPYQLPQILVIAHEPNCVSLTGRGEMCQPEIHLLTCGREEYESEIPRPRYAVEFYDRLPEAQPVCGILESLGLVGWRRK